MNTYEFGKFLAQLRKEKGLTQIQLAEQLNVTDKAISRWETGKNYPDIEIFEDLSNIFDVSISELLEGKRIEKENLFNVSEEHIVNQIKKNKKSNKKYKIILCIVIIIFTIISGYIVMQTNGVFDGVIYNKIPCYSNDILTIMNNIDGYITKRPKSSGDFIIDYGYFFMEHNKTTNDIFYLKGTCENGRSFYVNTMYDEENPKNSNYFIGEFRKNEECVNGIPFEDLKRIVSQLDLSSLPYHDKYELTIRDVSFYNEDDLNSNDYQRSIQKLVFSDGVLQKYTENTLHGNFLLITITGFDNGNGEMISYIFYKK